MTAGHHLDFASAATAELEEDLATGATPIAAFRNVLAKCNQRLFERLDEGAPIDDLVGARSLLVDALMRKAWALHVPAAAGAALVAVGGYGRGELHPASDVDILILRENTKPGALSEAIEGLIAFSWDIGMEVGPSVRTIEECVSEAKADVTVMTNLLEARYLTGNAGIFARMREATGPDHIWPSEAFFAAKIQEQRLRWHKYGNTAYNLEPNIKENPGGLRDIQMIGWVAKRHFAISHLHDLVDHGFLTEGENLTLVEGQALLWRIRFQLHRLAGRREDRLLFDYQRTLACEFGFVDRGDTLGVEQFMQQYYRTVMELNRLNDMLLQLFEEAILLHDQLDPPVEINKRFQSRSGFLESTSKNVFRRNPVSLLEVFHIIQTHPDIVGVRASTIRLIRENRHHIDDKVRSDLGARSLFMEILRHPTGVTHALRRMNRYGVLAAYIPVFANIVGRMQYDLFHVYTVDEHSLRTVRNLRHLAIPAHAHEFPLASAIAHTIPKLELLYLAGLFHDIGKGRGGDHSLIGAQDARDFCQLHGLSDYDSRLVSWLVEKHLIMSMTAQRKDTGDPEIIQDFAAQIGDATRLDYLYLLTVADTRATNPERWNSWKDSLLRDLYHSTRRALLRGLDKPQAQDDLIGQKRIEALRLVSRYGVAADACKALWRKFTRDFFLQNSPDEIAWQTGLVLNTPEEALPLVTIRPVTARGGTEIFIYTHDRRNLFSHTTALLDRQGMSILNARIMTTDDHMALNTYSVLELDDEPDEEIHAKIIESLKQALSEGLDSEIYVARRLPRGHKNFPMRTTVTFTLDERNQRTVMRLTTLDRPGLLAKIGAAFEACGIRLQNAKIATVGAEVEDVFFITNQDETAITREATLACIRNEIHNRLESPSDD